MLDIDLWQVRPWVDNSMHCYEKKMRVIKNRVPQIEAGSEFARARLDGKRRKFLLFLVCSLAMHVLFFQVSLDGHRVMSVRLPPVLDVVIAEQEPEILPVPQPSPLASRPATARPKSVLREVAPVSASVTLPSPEVARQVITENDVWSAAPVAEASPVPPPVRPEIQVTTPTVGAVYLRNPPPRYPLAARRNGDQGIVMLRVLVSAEGLPVRVEVDQSSGFLLLDGAAADAVRGWRFVPARRGERNVEDWVRVPVEFRLEGAA